jgi:hypothetical protein
MFNPTSTSGVLVCNYFYLRTTGTLDITLSSFHNRVLVCATTVLPSTTLAAAAYASALDRQSSNTITTISHIDNKTATTTATAITTKDRNQTNTGLQPQPSPPLPALANATNRNKERTSHYHPRPATVIHAATMTARWPQHLPAP